MVCEGRAAPGWLSSNSGTPGDVVRNVLLSVETGTLASASLEDRSDVVGGFSEHDAPSRRHRAVASAYAGRWDSVISEWL